VNTSLGKVAVRVKARAGTFGSSFCVVDYEVELRRSGRSNIERGLKSVIFAVSDDHSKALTRNHGSPSGSLLAALLRAFPYAMRSTICLVGQAKVPFTLSLNVRRGTAEQKYIPWLRARKGMLPALTSTIGSRAFREIEDRMLVATGSLLVT
jgi:hypothetical protein